MVLHYLLTKHFVIIVCILLKSPSIVVKLTLMKRHRSTHYLLIVIVSVLFSYSKSNAQLTMYLDSVKNVCLSDSFVHVPLRTKKFKNILEIQGAIKWNPAILQFTSFNYGNSNPLQLDSSMVNIDSINGYFLIAWFASNIMVPVSVSDTTILLSLNFKVKNILVGNTDFKFTSYPTFPNAIAPPLPSQIVDSSFKVLTDTLFVPGNISFITPPVVIQNGNSLEAVAYGSPISYQWNFAGVPVSGETNASYVNPTNVGGSYTITAYYADGCNLTSNSIILPIVLKDFRGYYKAGKAELFWSSSFEINGAYFIIERSTDGKKFVAINKVKTSNNKSGTNYNYSDVLSSVSDKAYYRLKMVDKDGTSSYSNVLALELTNTFSMSIFPNPVHDNLSLHIKNNYTENVLVKVIDMLGKVVLQQTAQLNMGSNTVNLNVSTLSKGNYTVIIKGNSQQQELFIKY